MLPLSLGSSSWVASSSELARWEVCLSLVFPCNTAMMTAVAIPVGNFNASRTMTSRLSYCENDSEQTEPQAPYHEAPQVQVDGRTL